MVVFNDALFIDAIQSIATAVERTASKRWALVHLCGEGDEPGHAATDDAFDDDEYEPAGPSSSGASGSQQQSSAPAAASCSPPSAPPARAKRKADCLKRQEAPPQKRSCCEKGLNWKILSRQIAFQNVHNVFVEGYKAAVNGEHAKAGGSFQGQLLSIPLWPQYHLVRADGAPVKGTELNTTWIHANVSEQWLNDIADAVANVCVRALVSATMKQLRPLFPDNLTAAVTNVAIGKHTIRCFRYDKKIGIVVDKATYDFVAEYVVPLVRRVAQNLKKSPASGGGLAPRTSPAPFHFKPSPTPSIKDRVIWEPMQFAWSVLTKDAEMKSHVDRLTVDRDTKLFAQSKIEKYREAVELWNSRDKSSRKRIDLSSVLGTPDAQPLAAE